MPSQYEQLARGALLGVTPAANVGDYCGETDEGAGVTSVLFDSAQPGYPGWKWTVSIGHVAGEEPTVLEAELMPGDGSLLSPDWVPWSDRLADYKAAQDALGESADAGDGADHGPDGGDDGLDDDELDDDDDELDDDDDELDDDLDDEPDLLHGGDLDGVDIDDLDEPDDLDDDDDDLDDDDDDDRDEQEKSY